MFHSIRWRLVASFMFITLLTVSVVGVLALSLVEHYAARRESEALTANARALADRSITLLEPEAHLSGLGELAQTAAFLGQARVRVLDEERAVLADSGPRERVSRFVTLGSGEWPDADGPLAGSLEHIEGLPPIVLGAPGAPGATIIRMAHDGDPLPPSLAEGIEMIVVEHADGLLGGRLAFDIAVEDDVVTSWTDENGATRSATPRTRAVHVAVPRLDFLHRDPVEAQIVTVPVLGGAEAPLGYVELSRETGFAAEARAAARRAFALAGLGATLLAAVVGLAVSRGLTAPLAELNVAAGRMSGGDLSARAPVQGRDEIGGLAAQFNRMAERLETSFADLEAEQETLRRFIADASHELRTPITALRTFVDLSRNAAADDPQARDEFLAESEAQIDRLEWITANLLDLSRLEAGIAMLELEEHDAATLVEAAVAPFRARAGEAGLTLEVAVAEPAPTVRCDAARVEMALANLLDNAIKFTPAGGTVTAGSDAEGDMARLWVRDTGTGIAPADRESIFERFHAGQAEGAGSGLGLAIVRGIAAAHGGTVRLVDEAEGGSTFVLELPAA